MINDDNVMIMYLYVWVRYDIVDIRYSEDPNLPEMAWYSTPCAMGNSPLLGKFPTR